MNSYDIIGDIRGHADELKSLLGSLEYQRRGHGYRHPDRQTVFVGDFVDRGPAVPEVVEVARAMVDAGDTLAVMGKHEYNAIAFHTPRTGKQDKRFRPHSDKNFKQHRPTLDQFSTRGMADAIRWFIQPPVAVLGCRRKKGSIRTLRSSPPRCSVWTLSLVLAGTRCTFAVRCGWDARRSPNVRAAATLSFRSGRCRAISRHG